MACYWRRELQDERMIVICDNEDASARDHGATQGWDEAKLW